MNAIKGQVERHVTGRVPGTSDGVYKVPFLRALYKATSAKNEPPKMKHVRRIILETHNVHGGVSMYREIAKRPIFKEDASCWNSLCTIHRVLLDGHPKVLKDSTFEARLFEDLRNTWSHLKGSGFFAPLIPGYCSFILEKITFHDKQPVFDGNVTLDGFLRKTDNRLPDTNTCFEIVNHLLDHQDGLLRFEKMIIGGAQRLLTSSMIFPLIPLVLESFNIYTVITYFMKDLINRVEDMELFDFLTERYYPQYMNLREFYFKANNIHEITSVIPVPMLSAEPPQFVRKEPISADRRRRQRTNSAKKRDYDKGLPSPPIIRHTQPVQQPPPLPQPVQQPQPVMFPPMQQMPQPQMMPVQPINPFLSDWNAQAQQQRMRSATTPMGWVPFGSEPSFNPMMTSAPAVPVRPHAPAAPLSGLTPPTSQTGSPQLPTQASAPGGSFFLQLMGIKDNPQASPPVERQPQSARTTRPPSDLVVSPSPHKTDEDVAALKRVQAESQGQLKEALEQLAKMKEENAQMKSKLAQLEGENMLLVENNKALLGQNNDLRQTITNMREDQEDEKRQRLTDELERASKAVDTSLFHLDSPTDRGNPDATARGLTEASKDLADKVADLMRAIQGGKEDEIKKAIDLLLESNRRFMAEAKGCTFLTENTEIRRMLLEAARMTGRTTSELLNSLTNSMVSADDWTDISPFQAKGDAIIRVVHDVSLAAQALEDDKEKQNPAPPEEDLEELAENELMAAAKIIEEAARQLLAAKNAPRPAKPAGEVDITGPIMDAAVAIAEAAAKLVRAGTEAQKERVAEGKLPNADSSYKRDPAWVEGLISAAKFVALATQRLTSAANDVVQGKVDDAALIAASKSVAAATAQLVAASKAKASSFSKPQENLMKASGMIKEATDKLVEAARAAADQRDRAEAAPLDLSSLSSTDYKIAQMNQATKILRLEQELQKARDGLKELRQAEYQVPKTVHPAAAPNFEQRFQY
eukprot:TRINITY_DN6586_c0_g2_i1.p1 TRINITY_DN6586_c0_g2~~TRINITY_DN6586_c0_g2_i1.p1  ORF type:complete len:980 (-),score=217.86 TRINITY_DN6586_c0_g2_i1:62-3001(-)